MTDQNYSGIFYAEDKDIYDLLRSKRKKATKAFLLDFLRRRGIFLSEEEEREDIVDYLCSLTIDLHGLEEIQDHLETRNRKDKLTTISIEKKYNINDFRQFGQKLKEKRKELLSESINTKVDGNNFIISVAYKEIDFSKTRLDQKRSKEDIIEIDLRDKTFIRHPCSDKSKEIVDELTNIMEKESVEIEKTRIELTSVRDPSERTSFFLGLIKNMDNFELEDVSKVGVDKNIAQSNDVNGYDGYGVNDEEGGDSYDNEEEVMTGMVRKALFDGRSLLHSKEYQELTKAGFYISKIVWLSKENSREAPIVEFEASLENPPEGTGFNYQVKGVFNRKSDNNYIKNKRVTITSDERQKYLKLIENAAWKSYENINV